MSLYLGNNLVSGVVTPIEPTRNIGQIIQSTLPLNDAGLHLLDGSLISGDGIYSDFYDYIISLYNDYPQIFANEQDWQQNVSNFGVCGKFVFNTTNRTVRLPKITGFIEGTADSSALGDLVNAGLPNITGQFGVISSADNLWKANMSSSGAFYPVTVLSGKQWFAQAISNTNSDTNDTGFDASRSSSIYGNSNTVQPQAIKVFYYIVVATTTKTDVQVDIDEIVTDLSHKVDKLDLATVHCVIETYINGTSWYRVYSDGWCEQGGSFTCSSAGQILTYLIPFIDTNYTMSASGGTNKFGNVAFYNRTTTQCACWVSDDDSFNAGIIFWQAYGYIS
jgi:hypothetical protein